MLTLPTRLKTGFNVRIYSAQDLKDALAAFAKLGYEPWSSVESFVDYYQEVSPKCTFLRMGIDEDNDLTLGTPRRYPDHLALYLKDFEFSVTQFIALFNA